MPSPADVVRQFLILKGAAVKPSPTPGAGQWGIVTGALPQGGADNYLAVMDTGGTYAGRSGPTGEQILSPTVVLNMRADIYPTGYDKGEALVELFRKVGLPVAKGGFGWVQMYVVGPGVAAYVLKAIHVLTPLQKVGQEEQNRRVLYSMNLQVDCVRNS